MSPSRDYIANAGSGRHGRGPDRCHPAGCRVVCREHPRRRMVHLLAWAQPDCGGGNVAALRVVPGFSPIVELSLTFHNQVVGANGQRQAMFLETPAAKRILRNYDLSETDSALVISSSGCNVVPSKSHRRFSNAAFALSPSSAASTPRPAAAGESGKNSKNSLISCSTPAPGWRCDGHRRHGHLSFGSTVGDRMRQCHQGRGGRSPGQGRHPPKVLTAGAIVGGERARIRGRLR